ncbi:hypothetical protein ACFWWC_42520 [Streptomyces sp. NPDC058642]|uniref:hypothetical protein n=1 Tax=Streptomyces sp. NPDC058642 TaxID=3346572 RepID=UPI00364AB342
MRRHVAAAPVDDVQRASSTDSADTTVFAMSAWYSCFSTLRTEPAAARATTGAEPKTLPFGEDHAEPGSPQVGQLPLIMARTSS